MRTHILILLTSSLLFSTILDNKVDALAIFPVAYRMHYNQQRLQPLKNRWEKDFRFGRPRALYQPMLKRDPLMVLKRERILDSLGGDYLIRKRTL